MTIPPAAVAVIKELKDAGFQAFLVGGCVRDMLRGAVPHDFDIATSATPEQVTALFARVIPTGIAHGTVTVVMKNQNVSRAADGRLEAHPTFSQFEVTTFRSEGVYTDGRRPDSVAFETDIVKDLSRRDFTINAMAYDPTDGKLVDPFEGKSDLNRRVIRCVGDPMERFAEDGLRCIRAVRFATTMRFSIGDRTFDAIGLNLEVFNKVAIERIQEEFFKILMSPNAADGLGSLENTGLLHEFMPNVSAPDARFNGLSRDLTLRLAKLVQLNGNSFNKLSKLKLPAETAKRIGILLDNPLPATLASDKEKRLWLRQIGNKLVPTKQEIVQALEFNMCQPDGLTASDFHKLAQDPLFAHQLAMDGNAIMAHLGMAKPGALVGKAQKALMELVLTDPANNTVQRLKEELDMLNRAG